jgi:hypothetical protein
MAQDAIWLSSLQTLRIIEPGGRFDMRRVIIWGSVAAFVAGPAIAAPGVGDPVYGASIEKGVTEFEARYGRLTGGVANGEDGLIFEVEHGFSDSFSAALLLETGRAPGGKRRTDALAAEAIFALGKIAPLNLDVAIYGEYKYGFRANADVVETKLLLQHRTGRFDGRLNLVAEKPLAPNEPVELAYAASFDWQVSGDEVKLGLAAFGDPGTTRKNVAGDRSISSDRLQSSRSNIWDRANWKSKQAGCAPSGRRVTIPMAKRAC